MKKKLLKLDLSGKLALVTGGSRGIGQAIARALAASGTDLAINFRVSHDQAQALVHEFQTGGSRVVAIQADLSDPQQARTLIARTQEALGRSIDILVNNAGSQIRQSDIENMSIDLWDKVLAVNLSSAMICSKLVIPGMKKNRWGRIINISSISARSGGGPGGSHYAAAKAAMNSLTRSLAKELGPHGITANAVAPGVILTDMHKEFSTPESLENLKEMTPLGRLGVPEDVAGAVLFLASDSASYITGQIIAINGGLRMD